MVQTSEERAAYVREYHQSPAGKKRGKIKNWKKYGIVSNDWNATYEKFMNTLNCENLQCNVLLTTGRYITATTKCLDHDHSIINEYNIRAVLCHSCNVNDRTDNTSGVPNVSMKGNYWRYQRIINGVAHRRGFKTFEEACAYKTEYELSLRITN